MVNFDYSTDRKILDIAFCVSAGQIYCLEQIPSWVDTEHPASYMEQQQQYVLPTPVITPKDPVVALDQWSLVPVVLSPGDNWQSQQTVLIIVTGKQGM